MDLRQCVIVYNPVQFNVLRWIKINGFSQAKFYSSHFHEIIALMVNKTAIIMKSRFSASWSFTIQTFHISLNMFYLPDLPVLTAWLLQKSIPPICVTLFIATNFSQLANHHHGGWCAVENDRFFEKKHDVTLQHTVVFRNKTALLTQSFSKFKAYNPVSHTASFGHAISSTLLQFLRTSYHHLGCLSPQFKFRLNNHFWECTSNPSSISWSSSFRIASQDAWRFQ